MQEFELHSPLPPRGAPHTRPGRRGTQHPARSPGLGRTVVGPRGYPASSALLRKGCLTGQQTGPELPAEAAQPRRRLLQHPPPGSVRGLPGCVAPQDAFQPRTALGTAARALVPLPRGGFASRSIPATMGRSPLRAGLCSRGPGDVPRQKR